MTVQHLIKHIENWAPPGAAWDKDNVGLQVGDTDGKVKNVLLALEMNKNVLKEASKKNCNFIFTHHPLLFKPLKSLDFRKDPKAKILKNLIENKITVYSAHTNLDFTKEGVSFELASKLGLNKVEFLLNQEGNQYKLVVFVPPEEIESVSNAIFKAGGGIIGEYNKCSYRLDGYGTFEGSKKSNPSVGKKGNLETVDEIRLEVLVDAWNLNQVVKSMKLAHSYEEPAFDIYPVSNINVNYGMGTIGNLETSLTPRSFLEHVTKKLNAKNVRYAKGSRTKIKRIAVCGGSGSELLETAIAAGADAFVTADVKYHSFESALDRILLVDAGHYETEIHSLNQVKKKIEKFVTQNNSDIKVFKFSGSTNPVSFYKT